MTAQLSLFELQDNGFISREQREIVQDNPFFKLFSGKTLDELMTTDQNINTGTFFSKDHPILEAFFTAQTIALEKCLTALDERFLRPYAGKFQIKRDDGDLQEIRYEFDPDYRPTDKPRTAPPKPRLQFFSEEPSPLSFTGFRHEPMNAIPFTLVSSMEELIELKVKEIVGKDDCEIIFF